MEKVSQRVSKGSVNELQEKQCVAVQRSSTCNSSQVLLLWGRGIEIWYYSLKASHIKFARWLF